MEEKLMQLKAKIEADGSISEKMFSKESPEEVQSFLKGEGLDFSLEEILTLRDLLVKMAEKGPDGELSDENLENVAGGIAPALVFAAIGAASSAGTFTHTVSRGRW